jgi:hypothetical protein
MIYSLIGSARLPGLEPRASVREALVRGIRNAGTATLPTSLK